ncbi:neurofilament medium polypeptide-like isoform X1 [Eleutherodactylus coqui]|uniref:neurofilament medium polypeptide-like isoform X1 n=2 Tax=Eleutherodactylus coqui TaxID=57060 RepID=UPI0034635A99
MGGECAALFRLSETMWTTEPSSFGFGSAYASVTSAEEFRLVTKCMQLLPSPLFKKERLMPTNPEAQKQYRPTIKEVIRPRPTKAELALRARAAIARMLCEGLEDEDEEEEEKQKDEDEEMKEEGREEEKEENIEDEEEREEKDLEDEEEEDQESSSDVPSDPLRGIQDRSLRRSRIRQRSIRHGSPRMWGKKNIMWTILRSTLHL